MPRPEVRTSPFGGEDFTFQRRRIAAKLVFVISRTEPTGTEATRRLTDLRRAQPADATLRNILRVLDSKLELCATLPVYEWEARSEGFEEAAAAFRSLAEAERTLCASILDRLREQLDLRAGTQQGGTE